MLTDQIGPRERIDQKARHSIPLIKRDAGDPSDDGNKGSVVIWFHCAAFLI